MGAFHCGYCRASPGGPGRRTLRRMTAIAYTVTAILPDEPTARAYLEWLEDGHVDAVIEGGAHSAMIVRVEDPPGPARVEVRYLFSTRDAFERYVRDHAPALRAAGLERFGPMRVRFERTVGRVI